MSIKAGASAKLHNSGKTTEESFFFYLKREGRCSSRERGYLPHLLLGSDINFAADSPGSINKF